MDDLLIEFLTETNESMETLDLELVKLEQNPNDPGLLSNIFRLVHTVKGTCGFLGLPRLEAVAHAGENVLGKIRDGQLEVTPIAISLVLSSLDRIKAILAELEASEQEPEGDDNDLINQLNALAEGKMPTPDSGAERSDAGQAPASSLAAKNIESQAAAVDDDSGFPVAAELLAEIKAAQDADRSANEAATPAPGEEAQSLYQRIGGAEAISAAVDLMYQKVLADDHLHPIFVGVDMDQLKGQQVAFVSATLGGPDEYTGVDLGRAHSHLVAQGLTEEHFDAVVEHLRDGLTELGVDDELIRDVLAVFETTRDDVFAAAAEAAPTVSAAATSKPAAPTSDSGRVKESSVAAQSIRVGVDVLENLMTKVSELVLTRNQLLQLHRASEESEDFNAPFQRLNHITSELQEGVMKTRMQPIGNAWSKLPRIIRDLSLELGKKIDLRMRGKDTELDRQVLELIRDPLTHMIRNSADHGLEAPAQRIEAGKDATGVIWLSAYHEGGHIIIEIKDDGRGLPVEKIKRKAIASDLVSETDLEGMTDQQIQQLIFKPGLSTAAQVTNVSGRGVGLDVVRTNIEKIGGTVELKSIEGKGTNFTIKIPLTLAIVSALVVECAGERFAIPQISVLELVRASSNSETRIESIDDAPVLRLRDRLLPLVSLKSELGLDAADAPRTDGTAEAGVERDGGEVDSLVSDEQFIVVTQVGTQTFGIIVDRVFDTEEIVVKPVAPILRDIQLFSGNTILGDGSVIMILDPNGIASVNGEISVDDNASDNIVAEAAGQLQDRVPLLIFCAGGETPKAVPLALVARLEEFDVDSIESNANGQMLVRYRGQLMPLVLIEGSTLRERGRQPVLVFAEGDRAMGLVVDEIVDIVETELNVEMPSNLAGFIGSAIIADKATDVVDVGHFLTEAFADWFQAHRTEAFGESAAARRVLLVDDSPFFRNMLTPLLQTAGYRVRAAESAKEALAMCEAGEDFDVIISDIEMPEMSGFEFARTVRSDTRWSDVPIVALSSHAAQQDLDRGREVGFTDYVAKFDRDALLQSLSQSIASSRGAA